VESFAADATRGYGESESDNALLHCENLDAMRRLANSGFAGRFRCIYFDPPFNSGRRFREYDDDLTPEAWRTMMTERIAVARELLAEDGSLFVEIDDTELGTLQLVMDEVMGRTQRLSTITIVRSAATGHKAVNAGLVNVVDYLLFYARDRSRWRGHALVRERAGYDRAYGTWLENPEDAPENWRFQPLAAHVREEMGGAISRGEIERHALAHPEHVVRFAQPRYEAVSSAARSLIDRSRLEPHRVFRLARKERRDLLLRGGNRILFLSAKVREIEGRRALVEPLTNVWDDMGFQGIAREGGSRFVRNKKPERLLARILSLSTDPGDWVLDAFLGSGTTAAVALKMGRRWVGIERGKHVDTLCLPRLRRVVDGSDPAGVTRAFGWSGGGGFRVWT
jgi:adenine-specific DNA-methyltransferase